MKLQRSQKTTGFALEVVLGMLRLGVRRQELLHWHEPQITLMCLSDLTLNFPQGLNLIAADHCQDFLNYWDKEICLTANLGCFSMNFASRNKN